MALIKCSECGMEISEKAVSCPGCGHPMQGMEELTRLARLAVWGYEWKSKTEINGWPLVHVAIGRSKKTGKLLVAKGIIAIGQFAIGVITIAQFGIGVIFGFGQFVTGLLAIGQFAFGGIVIAQFGVGMYVLAQIGYGTHIWSVKLKDPEAIKFFKDLWVPIKGLFR
ncbi:MAG: zinc ribbon domain-containing protein [PVC group bacterium]|nr:zinc ribbon domain-containing protein [PVC group bacterium]